MMTPQTPFNETERLAAVKSLQIIDTLPEDRYDRIVRIACEFFHVPICYISFMDEHRNWLKACIGLDVSETPRDVTFCGHAILSDDILVVPDAQKDIRFVDNPLVTGEPNIRFCAGCPVKSLD